MRLKLAVCLLFLAPLPVGADHDCDDGHPMGTPVKRAKALPPNWFRAGAVDITDPKAHVALKKRYGKQYVSGYDEGPYGSLCVRFKGGYVAIKTSDFGSGVEYSEVPSECVKCTASAANQSEYRSGTGLTLGLTKAQVSALLRTRIQSDLTDVTFDEIEGSGVNRELHTEILSLEFRNDRLVRFSVFDFRERA